MTTNNAKPGCLGALLRVFGIGRRAEEPVTTGPLPYRRRDDFLSPAELSFYRVLALAVGQRAVICPKVGLAEVFFVARPNENFAHYNAIRQKHVDFLLCDPDTLCLLAGIELDDASHGRRDRQERDEFVERVFQAASLPLLRFPVRSGYVVGEITAQLDSVLQPASAPDAAAPEPAAAPSPQPADVSADDAPLCPKCGVPMVLRTASRGDRAGQRFYGCPNYPKCREMLPADHAAPS